MQRVEELLDRVGRGSTEHAIFPKQTLGGLLRLLVQIDATLVKHEHTDIARRLRKAFDEAEDNL